jgi:hypothetical protein
MIQDTDLNELVNQIRVRRDAGRPFILFLGQECATAAGVPGLYQIAGELFSDADLASLYLHDGSLEDQQAVLDAFDDLMEEMTGGQRYRMLQSYYANIPVPSFYQDLALLIRAGYFKHILTTNIDNLLEQALAGAGMVEDRDYLVLVPGQKESLPWKHRQVNAADVEVHIIKLHGDLVQQQVSFTREEIADALEPQRYFIKGELSGDLVMVGYEFESEPLNQWLSWVPGLVWWVNAETPEEQRMAAMMRRRQVRQVQGDRARPQFFFGHLAWFLLPQPGQGEAAPRSPLEQMEPVPVPLGEEAEVAKGGGTDYSDVAYLEAQLQRSQALLQTLEQALSPGEKNMQLITQIEYQRRQVALLEGQLRSLEPYRSDLLKLVTQLHQSLQKAAGQPALDDDALAYLTGQIQAVEDQYRRDRPNQSIVSAAISATLVMVERLDVSGIDSQMVDELAAFAPGALGRRRP